MFPPTTLVALSLVAAGVGVRGQYVGYQAYDPTQPIVEPPLPEPAPPLDFPIDVTSVGAPPDITVPVLGSFLGISIEMVYVEDVIGPNKDGVHPEFLNFMSTIKARGGEPYLRLGGNSQEKAYLVDSIPGGKATAKETNPGMNTLTLIYTKGVADAMKTASDKVGINWYIGITMNQTDPPRLDWVELATSVFDDKIVSMQLGNEPDLYFTKYRPDDGSYTPEVYMGEVQTVLDAMSANPNIKKDSLKKIGGPSLCECNGAWRSPDVLKDLDYLGKYKDFLNTLIVEHYPTDNCATVADYRPTPQNFANGLARHSGGYSATSFAGGYRDKAVTAKAAGLPIVMLEMNTASCNGFLGVSDSFIATLWTLDVALSLAATGFTRAMLHFGGQRSYYNPFTFAPDNSSAPHKWTAGPTMYAILTVNEALGSSGKARVADLGANSGNDFTPGYVVYEDDKPDRLVLINFMSDKTGAHDYTAKVKVGDGVSEVSVRYLKAETIISKQGISYAGQTWGGYFETDGLLSGEQTTETVQCAGGECAVKVPAPGAAVVFLSKDHLYDAKTNPVQSFGPGGSGGDGNGNGGNGGNGGGGGTGAAGSRYAVGAGAVALAVFGAAMLL
ncbi:hypothetical protein AURDEDRAFT_81890 [Auricularia subglabra TFB-10046 SS5]|nr:hypothetical protein AURDEDRAFT_81890 [Auricularia subglabra TFB-10046 SS5]